MYLYTGEWPFHHASIHFCLFAIEWPKVITYYAFDVYPDDRIVEYTSIRGKTMTNPLDRYHYGGSSIARDIARYFAILSKRLGDLGPGHLKSDKDGGGRTPQAGSGQDVTPRPPDRKTYA